MAVADTVGVDSTPAFLAAADHIHNLPPVVARKILLAAVHSLLAATAELMAYLQLRIDATPFLKFT